MEKKENVNKDIENIEKYEEVNTDAFIDFDEEEEMEEIKKLEEEAKKREKELEELEEEA